MRRSLLGALVSLLTAVMLIACGGGGSSVGTSLTTREVQSMQSFAFLSLANNGIGIPFFIGGGTTGGSSGGGGFMGYPSMGGFIRYFGGVGTTGGTSGGTTGGTGGTTTSGGGGTQQSFYYDSWLQLWVDTSFTTNSFTSQFYIDEEKTLPAGHVISTYTGEWGTYPQSYTTEYEYTAGPLAGSHGNYQSTFVSESVGNMSYSNTYADGATDEGQSSWDEQGSSWSSEWHSAGNATWYMDEGAWNADGSGTWECTTSAGWVSTWNFNADWSGSAHFEGPDPLLPADMTWTSNGVYTISYANGLVETWTWEELWGDGSNGGGTSVGTSGGTSGGG